MMSAPERPRYREGQVLRLAELTDEQDSRIGAARRHALAQHGWGIARGLGVSVTAAGVEIAPGYAVDAYGRPLAIRRKQLLLWAQLPAPAAEVDLLLFADERVRQTPGNQNRVREGAEVRVVPVGTLPAGFGPVPAPEDLPAPDAAVVWPVRLARLAPAPVGGYRLLSDPPPDYASLIGEQITGPAGHRLTLGTAASGALLQVEIPDGDGLPVERFRLHRSSGARLLAATRIRGRVSASVLHPSAPVAEADTARPWRCYRAVPVADSTAISSEPGPPELRIEIATPRAVSASALAFTVGRRSNGGFEPLLTAEPNGTVRVPGRLTPQGLVLQAPARADRRDGRFTEALQSAWLTSISEASVRVDQRFSGTRFDGATMKIEIGAPEGAVPRPGDAFSWTIDLVNTGDTAIQSVRVVQAITVGAERGSGIPIATALRIEPRSVLSPPLLPFRLSVPAGTDGQVLTVVVTAFGLFPAGGIAWASDLMDRRIERVPPVSS